MTRKGEAKRLLAEARDLVALAEAAGWGRRAAALAAFEQLADRFQQLVLDAAPAVYRWLDPENDREQNG